MKKVLLLLLFVISLSFVVAAEIEIEKEVISDVVIAELGEPARFDFKIRNLGPSDDFEIYSLVGVSFSPKGFFEISAGEVKELEVEVFPSEKLRRDINGRLNFIYSIRGISSNATDDELSIRIIKLKDAIAISTINIVPGNELATIYIENRENFNFEDIEASFSSPFFSTQEQFSLGALEKKQFDVKIDKDRIIGLEAGQYILVANIEIGDVREEIEGKIYFIEKSGITTKEESSGFFIHTRKIEKINDGNVPELAQIKVRKNIISRLFTNFNIEPAAVDREGVSVYYTFISEVRPADSFVVIVSTNWIFPFLLIVGVIIIIMLARIYLTSHLILDKKVVFVKTKGGEFALKVILRVSARKYVDKISVIDRLPALVKVYERFGAYPPDKINKEARRLQWDIPSLSPGEERVFSYIIYSKVAVLGKFELPAATAIYEKDGKIKEAISNKAYFIAEQKTSEE